MSTQRPNMAGANPAIAPWLESTPPAGLPSLSLRR